MHTDNRLNNEIEHGKFLALNGAGEIWNWETPAGKLRWARRVKMLTDDLNEKSKVLELGCGTGYFTKELVKTKANITSIDISPDLLDIAKKDVQFDNVNFLIENAYEMSFAENSFDYVVGSSILHHLDIKQAFKEVYRVLKNNGKIFFTEPNMMNPQIALQKNIPSLKKRLGDSPDETAFFRWSLRKKLTKAGFTKISIQPFDFLHPQCPKPLIPLIDKTGRFVEKIPLLSEIAGSLYIIAEK